MSTPRPFPPSGKTCCRNTRQHGWRHTSLRVHGVPTLMPSSRASAPCSPVRRCRRCQPPSGHGSRPPSPPRQQSGPHPPSQHPPSQHPPTLRRGLPPARRGPARPGAADLPARAKPLPVARAAGGGSQHGPPASRDWRCGFPLSRPPSSSSRVRATGWPGWPQAASRVQQPVPRVPRRKRAASVGPRPVGLDSRAPLPSPAACHWWQAAPTTSRARSRHRPARC